MGMLFNTPDTLTLHGTVNSAFHRANFRHLQNTATAQFLSDIQQLGPTKKIYDIICAPLHIDNANVSLRWQHWLTLLDTTMQTNSGRTDYLSGWIGKGLYQALTMGRHTAVEFFAVPSPGVGISLNLPIYDLDDLEVHLKYTMIITVNTPVIDAFHGVPARDQAKRADP